MFYYQLVSYQIEDLYMSDPEEVKGPFENNEKRNEALEKDLNEKDLDFEIVAVSCFKVENGHLTLERSYVIDPELEKEDEEDD